MKKSVPLHDIVRYLNTELKIADWTDDPSNNGLQYEGRPEVSTFACAVDACDAVFGLAADAGADCLFVHHGLSWGSGIRRIDGVLGRRITRLATSGLSLYAAHLPLDMHPVFGHNAILCDLIGLTGRTPFGAYHGRKIGFCGELPEPKSAEEIMALYDKGLMSRGPFRTMFGGNRKHRKVAVISGGGAWAELFEECAEEGIDCLITGEATHECYHPAKEAGTEVISLGHYRSETPGVVAVAELVAQKFGIECPVLDYPTEL